MGAFRFRLESVLDWYRKQCELEKERLTACLTELHESREALRQLEAERSAIEQDILHRTSLPGADLVALALYRLRFTHRHMEIEEEIRRREIAVAEQTAKYAAAQRRQKLVEQLRERRHSEFVYAENRELETLAGESFLGQWTRSR